MIALYEITEENVNIWEGLFSVGEAIEIWFSHTADDEIIIEDAQTVGTGDKIHILKKDTIEDVEKFCYKWAMDLYKE